MQAENGRYALIYNGEIYNYKVLKQELRAAGVSFKGDSDTEVLLWLLITEKEKALEKLNGFFSFLFIDFETKFVLAARDRIGIKPFYFYKDDDKLLVASEMHPFYALNITKGIDRNSLFTYLQLNYIPAPHTIFQNAFKLPPGHCLTVKGKEVNTESWYEVPDTSSIGRILNYEEAGNQLIQLLEESVKDRLISDVPLGAFLSGGIDSSVVVALASRHTEHLNTFSVGFKGEPMFDETHYAHLVAERYKTNHTVFKLSNDDFFEHIGSLLNHFAEPFADASAIPFYILSQRTRGKVTVALSGDGADELFAGYHKYFGEFKARENGVAAQTLKAINPLLGVLPRSRNTPWGNKFRQLHRFSEGMRLDRKARYWFLTSWRDEREIPAMLHVNTWEKMDGALLSQYKDFYTESIQGGSFNEVLRADVKLLLPNDMLHKVDAMSMAHGLEVRVPFLDHRVVEWAFGMPDYYKIDGKMKKKILQDAARSILPEALYNRPKRGFEVPLAKGFRKQLRPWVEEMLDNDFVVEQGIFNPAYIKKLKKTLMRSTNYDQNQVWGILAFQQWWKTFGHRIQQGETLS